MSVALAAWLVVLWLALWGTLSFANLLSGVAVAALLAAVLRLGRPRVRGFRFRPIAVLHFLVFFAWKLVQSNLVVAWEVVTPRNRINTGVVAVPLEGCSDAVTTIVAQALTLTPGALSVEVAGDPPVLYLHVLHLHDADQVRADALRMEHLALRAFGSPEALAAFDREGQR